MNAAARLVMRRGDPRDLSHWAERLIQDRAIATRNQTPELRRITDIIVERALADGALGLALTGSTARARRTKISDLDYHVVGERPDISDLPADVDVYVSDPTRMRDKLLNGDDFVQWTICCGCILHDDGVFREAASLIVSHDLWPDGATKLRRLPELRRLAERLISVEDRDAAQDHVRATLTSAARGLLLDRGIFALARSELPQQLRDISKPALAEALDLCIYEEPSLSQLRLALRQVDLIELATAA